jgi:uncharacterized protein YabE (DUF348 family)
LVVLALGLTLIGGGSLYLRMDKEVTLVVDGEASTIRTLASTVGEVLDHEGIEIGSHDEIDPPPETDVEDGTTIDVLLGKQITLVLNGEERSIWIKGSLTVEEVLKQINIRAGRRAALSVSRGKTVEDGDVIVYREAVPITVTYRGETRELITNAEDVGYLLDSLGILLRKRDVVRPDIDAPLEKGMHVRVTNVRVKEVTEQVSIPFRTEVRHSDKYRQGEERVRREGSTGTREVTYRIRLENGEEVRRNQVSARVVKEPVSRIVIKGTRPPNSQTGGASWYHRDGMVAAHKTIPFGTRVTVTNLDNGKQVTVTINDRGPYVDGRIIDLSDDAFARLAPLSQGTCRVRISW